MQTETHKKGWLGTIAGLIGAIVGGAIFGPAHDKPAAQWMTDAAKAALRETAPTVLPHPGNAAALADLRAVLAYADKNQHLFHRRTALTAKPASGWLGTWEKGADWTGFVFFEKPLRDLLAAMGKEIKPTLEAWAGAGLIAAYTEKHHRGGTRIRHTINNWSVNGDRHRGLVIGRDVFERVTAG